MKEGGNICLSFDIPAATLLFAAYTEREDAMPSADELRPEYNLKNLRIRKMGPGRTSFGDTVRLEADKVTKDNTHTLRGSKNDI